MSPNQRCQRHRIHIALAHHPFQMPGQAVVFSASPHLQ